MKKLFIFFLVFLTLSCQEETEPTNPPLANFETQAVQIVLPEESSVDLNGAKLLSFGESFPVAADGKTKAVLLPNTGQIAYLFNKEGLLVMAGYITKEENKLSPATSALYLVYLASGYWLSSEDLASPFFQNIVKLEPVQDWQSEFEELWKSNPSLLSGDTFMGPLGELMEKIAPEPNVLDIRSRLAENGRISDISVDESDIKSGIQVFEKELGKIAVSNYYRRRAHAFFYKMKTKKSDGTEIEHLSSISKGTGSELDFPVSATTGFTTATGAIGGAIDGNIQKADVATTDPVSLSLADDEDEKTYQVRVVGAGGVNHSIPMTDLEQIKQIRLSMETFVLDFFLPIGMQMVGWKKNLNAAGFNVGEGPLVEFVDKMEVIINSSPATYDKIMAGDYKGALETFLEYIASEGAGNKYFEAVLKEIVLAVKYIASKQNVDIQGVSEKLDKGAIKSFGGILKFINTVMAGQDLARVSFGISMSKNIEKWTVHARSAKVSLLPADATVSSRGNQKITAEIKNLQEEGGDNFPYFKWSTSGKFGIIQDRRGNRGTDFESSDKEIIYYSQTNANDLPEENNFEYVYVEAYYKNELIGRDTTVLNLKKSSYQLKPGGLILTGKEDQLNSAKLFIEPVNQRDADFTGKKVVWSTEGKHGKLVSFDGISDVITTYDTNSITYVCSDKETKNGTETITARIYEKSAVDGEYFLYEELTQTIGIENSENVKLMTLNMDVKSIRSSAGGYISCSAAVLFYLEPQPDAISYTARVIDHNVANMIGRTFTWTNSLPPNEGSRYGLFQVFVNAAWGPDTGDYTTCNAIDEKAAQFRGKVQVRVQLKDPD